MAAAAPTGCQNLDVASFAWSGASGCLPYAEHHRVTLLYSDM